MECLLATVFFIGCLFLMLLLSGSVHSTSRRHNRVYEQLAGRFRGHAFRGNWWRLPHLRFQHGESRVLVDSFPSRQGPDRRMTRVQIEWPEDSLFAEIRSAGRRANRRDGATDGAGLRDVSLRTIGRYDYYVVTNDAASVHSLLTDGVQWHLDALHESLRESPLNLRIAYGRIVIHKSRWLTAFHELEPFVQQCLDLYDQAMIARTAGIAFLGENEAQVVNAKCPICGGRIDDDLVFCSRCKTPHHAECWAYNRVCSTYGCGTTEYRRPQGKEPTRDVPRPFNKPR